MAQPTTKEHAASRRTQLMSAIMSPGGELQLRRRETILAERQARGITDPGMGASANAKDNAGEASMKMAGHQDPTVPEGLGILVEPSGHTQSPPATFPSQAHYQQVQFLILEADAISGALASDNLAQFKGHIERLPGLLAPVQKEVAGPLHWETLLEPLAALSKGEPPKTLEQARSRFLPFSTGVVALAKRLRQDLPAFPKLKIYHCPMAPQPGLWMQVDGPLRNPFFGSKMLKCGEDVTDSKPAEKASEGKAS
jgi:hypothetical protein